MQMNVLTWIQKRILLRKWRMRKKRKKTLRLKIRNVIGVLQAIEKLGIRYVVLRWPGEVPRNPAQEKQYTEDIDLLADVEPNRFSDLADIVVRNAGSIPCDMYSVSGRGGTFYLGMPYYPPVLAEEILSSRCRFNDGFYVPDSRTAFLSLAFHLVYHKGLISGIPSGCELVSESSPKRPYQQLIETLGRSVGVPIEPTYTLFKLHVYLEQCLWNMPYDLLERWPVKSPWHQYLLEYEIGLLRPWAEKLPGLLVFFIREGVDSPQQVQCILDLLKQKFHILRQQQLDSGQITRVIRLVRGGNWIAHNGTHLVEPRIAVMCYDFHPQPVNPDNEEIRRKYPHVKNENVFHKQDIRIKLGQLSGSSEQVFGIHGSDNAYESQHMMRAIYDKNTDDVNRDMQEQVQKLMP